MKKSSTIPYWLEFFLALQLVGSPILPLNSQSVPSAVTATDRKPLLEVLIELNRTRGAYFLFSQPELGKTLVVPPTPNPNAAVERILSQLLRRTGLSYKKVDEQTFVILRRKKNPFPADTAAVPSLGEEDADAQGLPVQEAPAGMVNGKIIDR
ncbi:MAG TPA: hypothetical protein VGE93_19470, partial [Bryobacteraceae bacterium]